MLEIRTILCPTDMSESANAAFHLACALARDYGAKILVLYVYPPPANGAEAVDRSREPHFEEELIDTVRTSTPSHLGVVAEFQVAEGAMPADAIVDAARKCDLVVMGSHGRSGVRRAFMGSVAEHVMRHAPCPVMTVRLGTPVPAELAASAATSGKADFELGGGD